MLVNGHAIEAYFQWCIAKKYSWIYVFLTFLDLRCQ